MNRNYQPLLATLKQVRLSSAVSILLAIILAILLNNQVFFQQISPRLDYGKWDDVSYLVTFYWLMITVCVLPLLLLGFGRVAKGVIAALMITTSVISYFNQELGVIFDYEMMRNIVDNMTEVNTKEAFELFSPLLVLHVLFYGVVPSLILFIPQKKQTLKKQVISHLVTSGMVVGLLLILIMANFKYLSYFSRENRDLRVWVTPVFPLISLNRYIKDLSSEAIVVEPIATDAHIVRAHTKRTIGVMVVGETARADHFSLNGYDKLTNPYLEKRTNLTNFSQASSCGTSTAFSVPCIFSFYDKSDYSPNKAELKWNVLDVAQHAGVEVHWIDNNSSCKGVCARVDNINIFRNPDETSANYLDGEMYDIQLVSELENVLAQHEQTNPQKDILVVLHMMGSHGPAYHKRVPKEFVAFDDFCQNDAPQACTDEQVTRAYDNTIVYTDYVLNELISLLESKEQVEQTSFLMYVSDHGESLGENGVYLHGLPYFLAPTAQTHVPMMMWLSDRYQKANNLLNPKDIATQVSHDYMSHTLLDLFDIQTQVLKPEQSLLKLLRKGE